MKIDLKEYYVEGLEEQQVVYSSASEAVSKRARGERLREWDYS